MGRLIGMAAAPKRRGTMQPIDAGEIAVTSGLQGDARGRKPGRQLTVLFAEDWKSACDALGVELPWLQRRANLLVEGVKNPRRAGARVQIGGALLEVTEETAPCGLMDKAHPGLSRAVAPDCRGGVCCTVVEGAAVRVGDSVTLL